MDKYTERELHKLQTLRKIFKLADKVSGPLTALQAIAEIRALALPFVVTGPEETEPKP